MMLRPAEGVAAKAGTPTQPSASFMPSRGLIVLLAWDHAILATVTGGKCKLYEMISSALYELHRDKKPAGRLMSLVDFVFSPRQRNHCYQSWLWQQTLMKEHT